MRTHHTHFSLPLSASHYPQPCHHRAAMPSRHPTTAIRAHRPHSQPIHRTAFLATGHLSVSWRPFREAAGLRLSFTRSSPTCLKGKGHPVPGLHGERLGPGILPCLLAPHSLQAGSAQITREVSLSLSAPDPSPVTLWPNQTLKSGHEHIQIKMIHTMESLYRLKQSLQSSFLLPVKME